MRLIQTPASFLSNSRLLLEKDTSLPQFSFGPSSVFYFAFPRILWESVTPVMDCQSRFWGEIKVLTNLFLASESRSGFNQDMEAYLACLKEWAYQRPTRRKEILFLFGELVGRAYLMRDVVHHVGLNSDALGANTSVVFSHFCAMGKALQLQTSLFQRLFFISFRDSPKKWRRFEATFAYRNLHEGDTLYAEVLDQFIAAGKDFDQANAHLVKNLAMSTVLPMYKVTPLFPMPFF